MHGANQKGSTVAAGKVVGPVPLGPALPMATACNSNTIHVLPWELGSECGNPGLRANVALILNTACLQLYRSACAQ